MENRPEILVYACKADTAMLQEICAGIEEEGVLYRVVEQRSTDLDLLSYQAANDSVLGTGIGILGTQAAMQMRTVEKGRNTFVLRTPLDWQSRNLGANAARAVKRVSFKQIY
ncbi:MAG: glycerol dehydratase reactivase beta/small subunit family protein [Lachnospiraceae bacterium]